jgi:hypothetical protein
MMIFMIYDDRVYGSLFTVNDSDISRQNILPLENLEFLLIQGMISSGFTDMAATNSLPASPARAASTAAFSASRLAPIFYAPSSPMTPTTRTMIPTIKKLLINFILRDIFTYHTRTTPAGIVLDR